MPSFNKSESERQFKKAVENYKERPRIGRCPGRERRDREDDGKLHRIANTPDPFGGHFEFIVEFLPAEK